MYLQTDKEIISHLPFVPITIGRSENQSRVERPNGFETHQFIWVLQGEGLFRMNNQTKVLTKGQGLFTRVRTPHAYRSHSQTFSTMWVTFLNGEAMLNHYNIGDSLFFECPDFLNRTTAHLMELCQDTPSLSLRSAHGFTWFSSLLEALHTSSVPAKSKSEQITHFLELEFANPITLEDVSKYMGCDKYTLCHLYTAGTGTTIMQMLRKIRIQKAKSYLRYSTIPIEQIGKMCGFENPSYFIKVFREECLCTPKRYRQEKW